MDSIEFRDLKLAFVYHLISLLILYKKTSFFVRELQDNRDLIHTELENGDLISLEESLGSVVLDVLLFCNQDAGNDQVTNAFNIIGSL